MAPIGLRDLCTPAYVYLVISVITIVVILYQNRGDPLQYCVGNLTCSVPSVTMIFIVKAIYILFWTWVLNIICRSGGTGIAWFILLLPFIFMFIFITLFFVTNEVDYH